MKKPRVFLSYDFDRTDVLSWVEDVLVEIAGSEVELVVARKYRVEHSLSKLRRLIESCDVVFVAVTKQGDRRGEPGVSPWVLTEATFAKERAKKVAAIREKSVDVQDLGLAFESPGDIQAFERRDVGAAKNLIRDLLVDIVRPSAPFATIRGQKVVQVRRNGWVHNSMRYRQRVFRPDKHKAEHRIWRTHSPFDETQFVFGKGMQYDRPYLDAWQIFSKSGVRRRRLDIRNGHLGADGRQYTFSMDLHLEDVGRFGIVEYEYAWGYQSAFWPVEVLLDTEEFQYNSAGFRAGSAGLIREAILDLKFERPPDDQRMFEFDPEVRVAWRPKNDDESMVEYWRESNAWEEPIAVEEEAESTAGEAIYRVAVGDFRTMIRACWTPSEDYHIGVEKPNLQPPVDQEESAVEESDDELQDAARILTEEQGSIRKDAIVDVKNVLRSPKIHHDKLVSLAVQLATKYHDEFKGMKRIVAGLSNYARDSADEGLIQDIYHLCEQLGIDIKSEKSPSGRRSQ